MKSQTSFNNLNVAIAHSNKKLTQIWAGLKFVWKDMIWSSVKNRNCTALSLSELGKTLSVSVSLFGCYFCHIFQQLLCLLIVRKNLAVAFINLFYYKTFKIWQLFIHVNLRNLFTCKPNFTASVWIVQMLISMFCFLSTWLTFDQSWCYLYKSDNVEMTLV